MPRRSVASWVSLDTQGPCFCPLRLFPLPSGNVKSQHCRHPSHSTRQRALSAPLRPAVICAVHCDLQRARAARLWPPFPSCRLSPAVSRCCCPAATADATAAAAAAEAAAAAVASAATDAAIAAASSLLPPASCAAAAASHWAQRARTHPVQRAAQQGRRGGA